MIHRAQALKLAELRSRTDRELLVLVSNQLDYALRSAHAGDLIAAEDAYARVCRLFILIAHLSPDELRPVERKLSQLRERVTLGLRAACA